MSEIINELQPNAPISDPYLVIREYRCVIADYVAEFRQLRTEIDKKDKRIRELSESCDTTYQEAVELKEALGAWMGKVERLEAENARLNERLKKRDADCDAYCKDLETAWAKSDEIEARESALREAVAGLADECRNEPKFCADFIKKWKESTTDEIPPDSVRVALTAMNLFGRRLDAILKGGGE